MASLSSFMGGNSSSPRYIMIGMYQSAITWVVPETGNYRISVIGGGGGTGYNGYHDTTSVRSCGGAGGGFCQSLLPLTAGQSFTLTTTSTSGTYGGLDYTFSGNGINMFAGGGAAGSRSTSIAAVSAAGGTASGGTLFNVTGGTTRNTGGSAYTTGGGGVGILGVSPDVTDTLNGTGCVSPDSPWAFGWIPSYNSSNISEQDTPYIFNGALWIPRGSAGVAGGTGYWGGGGMGAASTAKAGNGGWFGGGGGCTTTAQSGVSTGPGNGGIGGGGGGVYNTSDNYISPGAFGGTGALFIEKQV